MIIYSGLFLIYWRSASTQSVYCESLTIIVNILNVYSGLSYWSAPISNRSGTDDLNDIITTNETWIYCYNHVFKQQTSEWVLQGSSCPLKPGAMISKMKYVVITFFDQEGLVYTHIVPDDQIVNMNWYVKVMKRLIKVYILSKRLHYCNGW